MIGKNLLRLLFVLLLLICSAVRSENDEQGKSENLEREENDEQKFYEVDAFGDDFVDFGAQTGELGQFSWHADFPLE
jgi:hypothetical protein